MGLKISSVLDRYGKCVSLQFPNKAYFTPPPTQPSVAQHHQPRPRIHWAAALSESVTKAYLQGY